MLTVVDLCERYNSKAVDLYGRQFLQLWKCMEAIISTVVHTYYLWKTYLPPYGRHNFLSMEDITSSVWRHNFLRMETYVTSSVWKTFLSQLWIFMKDISSTVEDLYERHNFHFFHSSGFVWKTWFLQLWICQEDITSTVMVFMDDIICRAAEPFVWRR
jgi:hypothetical protein